MTKKKLPIKKSADLQELAAKGITHAKLGKDGAYEARKGKKGATHQIVETPTSVLAEPLGKKANKVMAASAANYGPPRFSDEQPKPVSEAWHGAVPLGASHAEYATSTVAIVVPLHLVDDFRDFRGGKLRFGRLRYDTDFVSMMPGEEGEKTEGKSIVVREAPAPSPASGDTQAATATARPAKPAPARKPDQAGIYQNGVRKPTEGKTALVWSVCDELKSATNSPPTKEAVLAKLPSGFSPGTAGVQIAAWRRFYKGASA